MDEIKIQNQFESVIFIYLTILMSGASSVSQNDMVRILVLGVMLVYAIIKRRPLINNVLFYLLAGWIAINALASLYFGQGTDFYQFIGKIVLVYTAYLILVCCRRNFWEKFEFFLYRLVIISFIIYICSLLIPGVFDSLNPIFRPFTGEQFYMKESQKNYFYAFFFVYRGGDILFRNNGFMWEPGAYAMILNLLIAFNFAKYGLAINKHIKVYILALLTTFSTAGYLSLFVLLLLLLAKGKNIYIKVGAVLCVIVSIVLLFDTDFLLPKIEKFIEAAESGSVSHQNYRDLYEANRILSFKLLFEKFLMFPIGWGCVPDNTSYLAVNSIVTVNGLGNLLVTWGIFMFSFFVYSIVNFFYKYSGTIVNVSFFMLILFISFFSNPIENNILFYIMVLSPYVILQTVNNKEL